MKKLILCATLFLFTNQTFAQVQKFKHEEDLLSSFAVLQFWGIRDNTDGVFSKPLSEKIWTLLVSHNQIAFNEQKQNVANPFGITSEQRKKMIGQSDGALWGEIVRHQGAFKLRFVLFDKSGQLFSQSEDIIARDLSLAALESKSETTLSQLFGQIPYHGWVIGKKDKLVTLNFGSRQGARVNDEVSVVLITQLKRHPTEFFVTEVEKQFIGKVLIQKVESEISFGSIVQERLPNIIQVGSKFDSPKYLNYSPLLKTQDGRLIQPTSNSGEAELVVGKNPNEWQSQTPQYGKFGFGFGLNQNSISQALNIRGNISGSQSLLPAFSLSGEVWLTTNVTLDFQSLQSIGSLNLSSNASDTKLNYSDSEFNLGAAYRFAFSDDGARSFLSVGGRFFNFKNNIQETTSQDLTSTALSGLSLMLAMNYAIPDQSLALFANMELPLFSSSSETPVSSGSSISGSRNRFGVGVEYFVGPMKSWVFGWESAAYNFNFSGAGNRTEPASNSSQTISRLHAGLNFYF